MPARMPIALPQPLVEGLTQQPPGTIPSAVSPQGIGPPGPIPLPPPAPAMPVPPQLAPPGRGEGMPAPVGQQPLPQYQAVTQEDGSVALHLVRPDGSLGPVVRVIRMSGGR